MAHFCTTQVSVTTDEGRTVRPDAVVRLPGNQQLVIDAKVPFDSYVAAQSLQMIPTVNRRSRIAPAGSETRNRLRIAPGPTRILRLVGRAVRRIVSPSRRAPLWIRLPPQGRQYR